MESKYKPECGSKRAVSNDIEPAPSSHLLAAVRLNLACFISFNLGHLTCVFQGRLYQSAEGLSIPMSNLRLVLVF